MKNKVNTDTKTKNKENSTFKTNVYDLDSYEINKETCAVINLSDDFTKIIELGEEYILPKKTYEIMEDSCSYYGSSYQGRIKGTKKILGSNYKLPIVVEEKNYIIFFPTNGIENEKCSWLALNNISKYEKHGGYTRVTFSNGKKIIIKMTYATFELQLMRATRLLVLLKKRAGLE